MLWLIGRILLTTSDLVTKTFLAFYIWESGKDLGAIFIFALAYFAVTPIASLLAGLTSDYIEPKITLILGSWLRIGQLFVIIILSNNLTLENVALIAALGGLSEGFINVGKRVMDHDIEKISDQAQFHATITIRKSLLALIVPITAAYIVNSFNGYLILFRLTIFLLVITTFVTALLKNEHIQGNFNLKSILTFPGTNRDKKTLVKAVFIEGFSDGITLTILPIIILTMVGNVLNWGFLNTILVLIAIFVGLLLKGYINDKNSKVIYAVGATLFAASSVFFVHEFNFLILILFLLAKTLMDVIKETGYYSALEKIIEEDRREHKLYSEYQFLIETITSAGRIIPVLILIYLSININDEFIIRVLLFAVGILPLITLSTLGKSVVFEENFESTDIVESARKEDSPDLNPQPNANY